MEFFFFFNTKLCGYIQIYSILCWHSYKVLSLYHSLGDVRVKTKYCRLHFTTKEVRYIKVAFRIIRCGFLEKNWINVNHKDEIRKCNLCDWQECNTTEWYLIRNSALFDKIKIWLYLCMSFTLINKNIINR